MSEQASPPDHSAAVLRPQPELGTNQGGWAQPVRILVLAAVILGVAALAAAAFVLSYSGIHAVARQAGISPQHASDYPLLIDAMLVITLLAVLGLRGAGLPSRMLSWLALLCVLAAAAGADVLHATGRALPHNAGAATAAVLPWALVFIAFMLLLALLRHARLRRQASVAEPGMSAVTEDDADQLIATAPTASLPVRTPQPRDSASIMPGFSARLVSSAAAGAAASAAAADQPGPAPWDDPPGRDQDPGGTDRGSAAAENTDAEVTAEPDVPDQARGHSADMCRQSADADGDPGGGDGTAPGDAPAEPGDAAAEPAGLAAEAAEAEPADPAPADVPAEPADPADAAATPVDTSDVETLPATHESDHPGTSDPATADQGVDDDAADNMPVFHRMWSTPTPPDS